MLLEHLIEDKKVAVNRILEFASAKFYNKRRYIEEVIF
jgi:hypothetical protein